MANVILEEEHIEQELFVKTLFLKNVMSHNVFLHYPSHSPWTACYKKERL